MDIPRNWIRRVCAGTAVALVAACTSTAAATTIVDEPFGAGWTPGATWAVSGTYTPQVVAVSGQTPEYALRLTPATTNQSSSASYTLPQPTTGGLDVSFFVSQWGGSGADGALFFLRKGSDPSNAPGWLGGALGYSTEPGVGQPGMPGGLIGVGLDLFGNFSNSTFGGSNCPSSSQQANRITIRGPGSGTTGYCVIGQTTSGQVSFSSGTDNRTGRARSIRITVDPSTEPNPRIRVSYAANGSGTGLTEVLNVAAPAELLAEPTVKFGFSAGTGGSVNNHEVWGLKVDSLVSLPAVAITTTSLPGGTVGTAYTATTIATSDGVAPVTFGVSSGSLPPGLALDSSTGTISGTPTKSGTYSFTVAATDSRAPTASTGSRAYSIVVADSAAPCTPLDVTVAAGVGSAIITWKADPAPGCAGITRYEAEALSGQSCTATPPATSCTITGLPVGTAVQFRVRAGNPVGFSPWSSPSAAVTPIAGATIVRAAGGPGGVVMRVRTAAAGRLIISGARGGNWQTRAINPKSLRVSRARTVNVVSALTPATRAILRTRSLRIRLAATLVAADGTRTTSYTIITIRRQGTPPVTG